MNTTRRAFLGTTAAATAAGFTIVRPHVLGGPRHVAPSDTVNIALVGAGGQGRWNLHELFRLPDARVVAVVDPAEQWDLSSFYYRTAAGRNWLGLRQNGDFVVTGVSETPLLPGLGALILALGAFLLAWRREGR